MLILVADDAADATHVKKNYIILAFDLGCFFSPWVLCKSGRKRVKGWNLRKNKYPALRSAQGKTQIASFEIKPSVNNCPNFAVVREMPQSARHLDDSLHCHWDLNGDTELKQKQPYQNNEVFYPLERKLRSRKYEGATFGLLLHVFLKWENIPFIQKIGLLTKNV
ncbi:hypothetical protein EGR_08956 [Echinococcus granulosus]|uniref:Uncharacterized protein n=1 Tax=Echinococcus granulosus TaxID=6210 RepID=W6U4X1_ECHGR|nr:hypothetical protein EGR_08956 [Echinococcus granulosus]EUB56208.1 hypothetical protein EGR_08956 [Echinococcus granulosus]